MKKIILELSPVSGYIERTRENVRQSDVTLAIAKDFSTAGERLTYRCARNCHKPIVRVLHRATDFDGQVSQLVYTLNRAYEKKRAPIVLNGAGNGVYTLGESQDKADVFALRFLKAAMEHPCKRFELAEVRSGGQTGYDVAIIKAAMALGIPARIHCARAKGGLFMVRNSDGADTGLTYRDYMSFMGLEKI